MANTKVTSHVIANNAISASMIQSAAVTDAKLHSTLDLSGKTLTLPATTIPSASTATTQAASDNSTKIATTAYVTTAIGNLVDSAPGALDTLNELAAALGDDASFSSTITTSLATKAPINNPTFTGSISHASDLTLDVTGDINLDAGGANINFNDDGTAIGHIEMAGQNLEIRSKVADKDLILKGNDGGSSVTALTLDMSEAGFAIFNSGGSFGGTGALKVPVGTTAQRPTAATGQLRWNSTDGALEVYNGSAWTAVGTGSSNKVLDTFTGNGSNTTFTLSVTPANEDAIMVFIDGAYQEKSDYVLTNNSLALDVAPLSGEKIAVHTTTASVHDGTTAVNQQFTGDGTTAGFTLSQDPKSENNTQVYINGVYQQKTDYTVTGTTLTFDTAPTNGDIIEVNMFTVATLGNTDTVTEGVSNQYFTNARARGAISVSGNAISYNSSTGVLTANFEEGPVFTSSVQVSGNNHIGIGGNDFNTTAGTNTLTVGTVGSTTGGIQLFSPTNGEHWINWGDTNSSTGRYKGRIGYNHVDDALMFYSSGTEQMRIDNNGKILLTSTLISSNTSDGSDNKSIMINGGGAASDTRGGYVIVHGNEHSANPGITRIHAGNVGTAETQFFTAGSQRMTLDSSGNLGIGETNPGVKLDVAGEVRSTSQVGYRHVAHAIESGHSSAHSVQIGRWPSSGARWLMVPEPEGSPSYSKEFGYNFANDKWFVEGDFITDIIDSSQGIRISQDFGSGVPTLGLTGTTSNGRAGAIHFKEYGDVDTAAIYSTDGASGNANYGGLTIATYQSDIRFSTGGLSGTKMIIKENGNVGIGTGATASKRLHITGNDNQLVIDGNSASANSGLFFAEQGTDKWEVYHRGADDTFRIYNYATSSPNFIITSAGRLQLDKYSIKFDGTAQGKHEIRTGGRTGTGTYTLFTNGISTTQSAGIVEVWGIYGTPSGASYRMYVISGNRSIATAVAHTQTNSVPTPVLAWSGAALQISNSNSSLYYHVRVTLHDIGNGWAATWGNFPGMG